MFEGTPMQLPNQNAFPCDLRWWVARREARGAAAGAQLFATWCMQGCWVVGALLMNAVILPSLRSLWHVR
eukprot:6360492-Lingulodinium_polyedra.AAC.1